MSQKTLKTKRIFVNAIHNSLRNVPPKDFPTTGEIKSTINNILPALREHIEFYTELGKRAGELQEKFKELSEDEQKAAVEKINADSRTYNKEHAEDVVDVVLDDEGFKTLKAQFERENWGKNWLMNIQEFSELMSAFEEAGK